MNDPKPNDQTESGEMTRCGIRPFWFTFSPNRTKWGDPKDTFYFNNERKETSKGTMFVIYNSKKNAYLVHPRWVTGLGKMI